MKAKTPSEIMIDNCVKPTNMKPPEDGSKYTTHEGILKIGDVEMRVYVLNTGERVIDADDIEKFFSV